jgi:putative transposase
MASVAARRSLMVDGVERCPSLAHRWHLASETDGLARKDARASGTRTYAQRGDHRASVREHQSQRGARGSDGGKNVTGRTRHLLVDTTGMILHVLVHTADIQDHAGGQLLLETLGGCFPRLRLIWVESASKKGDFMEWVKETLGWEVEAVEHPWTGQRGVWAPQDTVIDPQQIRPSGLHVLTWRWIVERPFAWLSTWRRLAKDEELLPSSEEAWICLAMSRLMLRRVAHNSS